MSIIRRIARNTASMMTGEIISKAILFFLMIYLARIYGAEGFGVFSFVISFPLLFSIIGEPGISAYINREITRNKDKVSYYITNALALKLILVFIMVIVTTLAVYLLGYAFHIVVLIFFYSIYVASDSIFNVYRNTYWAFEKMHIEAIMNIVERVIFAILIILVVSMSHSLFYPIMAFVIAGLIKLIISFFLFRKKTQFNLISLSVFKNFLIKSLPFALLYIFFVLYNKIDITMISYMVGNTKVGFYSAAFNLISAVLVIPMAFGGALRPVFIIKYAESKDALRGVFNKGLIYTASFIILCSLILIKLSNYIINLIYGAEFTSASFTLRLLSLSLIFFSLIYPLRMTLIAINKEKIIIYLFMIGVLINVVLNYLLIPIYYQNGAAIATVVSSSILFLGYYLYLLKDKIITNALNKNMLKIVFVILITLLIFFYIQNIILNIILMIVIYIFLFLALKIITRQEIIYFKELIGFRK